MEIKGRSGESVSERSGRRTNEREIEWDVSASERTVSKEERRHRERRERRKEPTHTNRRRERREGGREGGASEEDKRVSSSAFSCIPLCHGGQRLRHASSVLVVHSLRGQRAVRLRYTRLEERDWRKKGCRGRDGKRR